MSGLGLQRHLTPLFIKLNCLSLSVRLTDPSQSAAAAVAAAAGSAEPGARRMVAIFDYDPRESSPNTDIEVRLTRVFIGGNMPCVQW